MVNFCDRPWRGAATPKGRGQLVREKVPMDLDHADKLSALLKIPRAAGGTNNLELF